MGGLEPGFEMITFDELEGLGCPKDLLMQYLGWTHAEILNLIVKTTSAKELVTDLIEAKGKAHEGQ